MKFKRDQIKIFNPNKNWTTNLSNKFIIPSFYRKKKVNCLSLKV